MKVTLIRTDERNQQHLQVIDLQKLMDRIGKDNAKGTVGELRREIPFLDRDRTFYHLHLLPRVYPALVMRKTGDGRLAVHEYNGTVLLTVADLLRQEDIEAAKAAAAQMPMTLAAFAGASGRSVKVLVSTSLAKGGAPRCEEDAERLYRAAYPYAAKLYGAVMRGLIKGVEPSTKNSFRLTVDAEPYLNPDATPLLIDAGKTENENERTAAALPEDMATETKQDHTDLVRYDDMEFIYQRAVDMVTKEMGWNDDEQPFGAEAFRTRVAHQLCQLGMPEEEALLHMRAHSWTRDEVERARTLVATAYAETKAGKKQNRDFSTSVRRGQIQLIHFLERRYVFRYNEVMKYTEYRPNNTWVSDYQPVDARVQNRLAIEARLEGVNAWDKDVKRYVESDYVKTYSPIEDFLWRCHGRWDGRDRIRELARTVPTCNPHWEDWFYTWFLAVVNQWRSTGNNRYGNSAAPLLISRQGYNKSTFCRQLLPPELQWGYNDNLLLTEKKQVLQAMGELLLINLDEFNQISPQVQQGFLKNVIQLPNVKVKRPYGKHVETFPRLASFIATSNMTDVLTDPSGCRRFIGIELTGPIHVTTLPDYEQLYAQALDALGRKEPCYFDDRQTQLIMQNNRQFQAQSPGEQYFEDYFTPGDEADSQAKYLTTTAIMTYLKKKVGAGIKATSLRDLGRFLANRDGLTRKKTRTGSAYLVKIRE
jgi:hypothetical protein